MSARVGHASYTPPAVDELYLAQGLSFKQVAHARAADETNEFDNSSSRSIVAILRANVFTIFNAILASAVVVVLVVGSWQDAVFGFVLLLNTLTGTIAELRAKRALDNLAVLAAPAAHVIRDGEAKDIEVSQVVLGELLELRSGDQVPALDRPSGTRSTAQSPPSKPRHRSTSTSLTLTEPLHKFDLVAVKELQTR